MKRIAALVALAVRLSAQPPGIGQNGVYNAASQIAPTLPGGAIARGALFRIIGVRLRSVASKPDIVFQQGPVSVPVPVTESGPRFITAVIPRNAPLGSGVLVVTVDGKSSRPFPIEVAASNPGLFSANSNGWGPGRIENISSSGARFTNSPENAARRGQRIALFATGLGDASEARVVIGSRQVRAERIRSAGSTGVDEITVRIPSDAPTSCYVPVYLQISPKQASNVVLLSIRSESRPCDAVLMPELKGAQLGLFGFYRLKMKSTTQAPDRIEDDSAVRLGSRAGSGRMPLQLPPPGTCLKYTSTFQSNTASPTSLGQIIRMLEPGDVEGRPLDGGSSVTVSRDRERRILPQVGELGYYHERLGVGANARNRSSVATFLEPGSLSVNIPGGSDVGPFTVTVRAPDPFEWIGRDNLNEIDRGRPLTLRWKGAARGRFMLVVATNLDEITTSSGTCVCTALAESGEFTIPAGLLSNLPASAGYRGADYDRLIIASVDASRVRDLGGKLDDATAINGYVIGRVVRYK